ncbi:MAG: fasciclin domain-containing protein [Alkalilacustris sp.]
MIRKTLLSMTAVAALAAPAMADDIVDVAAGAGSFTTLIAAVQAAGLEETLRGEGPFTVFAPTDEAFAALPEGTVEALLEDTEALTAILTYHVVPGAVMSSDLTDGMTAETVNGQSVTIGVGDTVTVDGATVTTADIEASNGVIHVIDAVILPE